MATATRRSSRKTKINNTVAEVAIGSRSRANSNGTPKYQPMPDLSPDEFEVLKADIAENGLLYSVIKDEFGSTLDGHQREKALRNSPEIDSRYQVVSGIAV